MKLKILLFVLCASFMTTDAFSQTSGSITVHGDFDKYYPVTWKDGNWLGHRQTNLQVGRADVHTNSSWRGSFVSSFSYHVNNYGHQAKFINASIASFNANFIGGWRDATDNNTSFRIIIWLKGGGTTYYYNADADVSPLVYDNVQNPLPYNEDGGPSHTFKTMIDPYVNISGESFPSVAYFNGAGTNHFKGNLGIGTTDTKGHKLAVAGSVVAESVKVKLQGSWPDYVFDENYRLMPLHEAEEYIVSHGHLPDMPSADEVKKNGIDIGEINAKLLKKIEELTLHLIQLKKEVDDLKAKR